MNDPIDIEIREIIAMYSREVKEEKIHAAMFAAPYDSRGMLDRIIILKAIG